MARTERPRLGAPHVLGLSRSSFKHVICVKARESAHSGILELCALILLVRWILRSTDRHSRRIVVLLDAKSVLGAAAKGRSSSPPLLRILRRLGALTVAGDLLLRFVYVPSEDIPADPPSRGILRRAPRSTRPSRTSSIGPRLLSRLFDRDKALRRADPDAFLSSGSDSGGGSDFDDGYVYGS